MYFGNFGSYYYKMLKLWVSSLYFPFMVKGEVLATESKLFLNFLSKIYCINNEIVVESKPLKLRVSLYIKCQGPYLLS